MGLYNLYPAYRAGARQLGRRGIRSRKQMIAIILALRDKGMGGALGQEAAARRVAQKLSGRRLRGFEGLKIRRDLISSLVNVKGPLLRITGDLKQYLDSVIDKSTKEGARRAARLMRSKVLAARQYVQDRFLTGQTNEFFKAPLRTIARRSGVPFPEDIFASRVKVGTGVIGKRTLGVDVSSIVTPSVKYGRSPGPQPVPGATGGEIGKVLGSISKEKQALLKAQPMKVMLPSGRAVRVRSTRFRKTLEAQGGQTVIRMSPSAQAQMKELKAPVSMTGYLRRKSKYARFMETVRFKSSNFMRPRSRTSASRFKKVEFPGTSAPAHLSTIRPNQ